MPEGEMSYAEATQDLLGTCRVEVAARFPGRSVAGVLVSFYPERREGSNWVFLTAISAADRLPVFSYQKASEHAGVFLDEFVRQSVTTYALRYPLALEDSYSGAIVDFSLTNAHVVGKRSWHNWYEGLDRVPIVTYSLEVRGYSASFEPVVPEPALLSCFLVLASCKVLGRKIGSCVN